MSSFLRFSGLALLGLVGCKPVQNADSSRDLSFIGPSGTPRITLAYVKSSKLVDDGIAPTTGVCEGGNGYTDCKEEPRHAKGFCAYEEDVRVKAVVLDPVREKRQNPDTFKVQEVDVTKTRYTYKSLHAQNIDEMAIIWARNDFYKTLNDNNSETVAVEQMRKRFENLETTAYTAIKVSSSEYAATLRLVKKLISVRKYLLPEPCAKTITQDEELLKWL
jgi:hypothetical protein